MKQRSLAILFVSLTVMILATLSCRKDEMYMSNAEITGWDLRMCPCCGGTIITIDNVRSPNGNVYFLIEQLPSGFTLGNNPKFPIAVKIDWEIDTTHCFGNYINITRIEKR